MGHLLENIDLKIAQQYVLKINLLHHQLTFYFFSLKGAPSEFNLDSSGSFLVRQYEGKARVSKASIRQGMGMELAVIRATV